MALSRDLLLGLAHTSSRVSLQAYNTIKGLGLARKLIRRGTRAGAGKGDPFTQSSIEGSKPLMFTNKRVSM